MEAGISILKKVDQYRQILHSQPDWNAYLLANCGLPGPRANLELAWAVALEGHPSLFYQYLDFTPSLAPTNSPQEFLAFCGVLGLGQMLANGKNAVLPELRGLASDPRWRIREAVAMALQSFGRVDMPALISEMKLWSEGSLLERRAAAAGLCEPSLLTNSQEARAVLSILNRITVTLITENDRRCDEFKSLRKALGYCWSVAVVALPETGKTLMENWFDCEDKDIRWIMRQNLQKKRLQKLDSEWVAASIQRLQL